MLKQPDRIVIYPQRDSKPGYLLCWIPPREYSFVSAGSQDIEDELHDYYPTGIETEFSEEGFEEFGISIPYEITEISQTFLNLQKAGVLDELEFVELKRIAAYIKDQDSQSVQDSLEDFSNGKITIDELSQTQAFKKLLSEPKTKGGEDPGEAFQKLSGQMESPTE
jgi:hypothetical protein